MEIKRVIGKGTFGMVVQAVLTESGERVAVKKVMQDPKFKNRELDVWRTLSEIPHHNILPLFHHFYTEENDQRWLHMVMEPMQIDLGKLIAQYKHREASLSQKYVKLYAYQIARGLLAMHARGFCHRDVKPHNVLLNAKTNVIKLCDFGSTKQLVPGKPNVSYICTRYYRAPEIIFEATNYDFAIDVWSLACVVGEVVRGAPIFRGDSSIDQLIRIIQVLGTPTKDEIRAMVNPPFILVIILACSL